MTKAAVVKKILKYVFLAVIAGFVLFVSIYFINRIIKPRPSEKETFDTTNIESYRPKSSVLQEALVESSGYWDSWTWQEKIIEADVITVDLENKELSLQVRRPYGQPISRKIINPYITCSSDETIAVSSMNPTQNFEGGGFDLFDKVEEGDLLMTYCLDEECLNVGKLCILVKM